MSNWNSVAVATANMPTSWDLMYFFPQMQSSSTAILSSNALQCRSATLAPSYHPTYLPGNGETSTLPPLTLALKLDDMDQQSPLDCRQTAVVEDQVRHSRVLKVEEEKKEDKEDSSSCSMVKHYSAATTGDCKDVLGDDALTIVSATGHHDEPTNGFAGRRKQSKPLRVDKLAEELLAAKVQQNHVDEVDKAAASVHVVAPVGTTKRPDMTTNCAAATNGLSSLLPAMFPGVNSLNQFANLMFFNPYAVAAVAAATSSVSSCISTSPSCTSTTSAFMSMTPGSGGANHMFLTPNLSGATAATSSHAIMEQHTKTAMFNCSHEAYCDICQKSVCNKYFLKQHMINQHGIRDWNAMSNSCVVSSQSSHPNSLQHKVGPSESSSAAPSQSYVGRKVEETPVNLCTKETGGGLNLTTKQPQVNKAVQLTYSNELDHVFNFKLSSPPPGHPLDIQRRVEDIRLLNMMQQATSQPRQIDPESFCVLCNKEFANKYTLKMHRSNIHPELCAKEVSSSTKCVNTIGSESIGPTTVSASDSNNSTENFVAMDNFQSSMLAAKLADRVTCDVCNKELCNKYFLKTHKQKVHGLAVDLVLTSPSSNGSNGSHFHDSDNTGAAGALNGYISSPISYNAPLDMVVNNSHKSSSLIVPSSSASWPASNVASQRDENSNSACSNDTEAYCHLCKKEFCSKYFLRTHRANIHGIVEEDSHLSYTSASEHQLLAPASKSSIINGAYSNSKQNDVTASVLMPSVRWPTRNSLQQQRVRCNVCGKEVCNKYFLRNHKLKKHGIPLDASAMPATRPQPMPSSRLSEQSTPTPSAMEASVYQDVISATCTDMPACPLCSLLCPDGNHLAMHMQTEHAEICASRTSQAFFSKSRKLLDSPSSSFFEDNVPLNLSVSDILKRTSRSPTTAPFTEPDQPEGAEEHHPPSAKQVCQRFPILTV